MGKKRERLPLMEERFLTELPTWVRAKYRPTKAHLAFEGGSFGGTLRIYSPCGALYPQPAKYYEQAHPDDRKCKRCLAWERAQAKKED